MIQIDHRALRQMVMKALGANQPPLYTIFDCHEWGQSFHQAGCIVCTILSQKIYTAVVESEPSQSRMVAEKDAVMKAFKHLNDKHLIKIKDFSSRVAHDVESNSAFGDVNSAMHSVEKLIDQWEIVMDKCQNIAVELAGKEDTDDNEQKDVYGDFNQFIQMMVDAYKLDVAQARAKAKDLECERKKYHSRSTERYHTDLRKA